DDDQDDDADAHPLPGVAASLRRIWRVGQLADWQLRLFAWVGIGRALLLGGCRRVGKALLLVIHVHSSVVCPLWVPSLVACLYHSIRGRYGGTLPKVCQINGVSRLMLCRDQSPVRWRRKRVATWAGVGMPSAPGCSTTNEATQLA